MWFISTIFQFYFAWPLLVFVFEKTKYPFIICTVISLLWTALVGQLGLDGDRVWGSFFLKYIWEFIFGMLLARMYFMSSKNTPQWYKVLFVFLCSFIAVLICIGVGGYIKLYIDFPSSIAILTFSVLLYQVFPIKMRKFFCVINKVSYEWYLVHMLVYNIIIYYTQNIIPPLVQFVLCFLFSYIVACLYKWVLHNPCGMFNNSSLRQK